MRRASFGKSLTIVGDEEAIAFDGLAAGHDAPLVRGLIRAER
jgi:hypothetical protein